MWGKTRSAALDRERMASRRKKRRQRFVVTSVLLGLLLIAGAIYELNQPHVRIAQVNIYGADQSYAAVAYRALEGKYWGLIPRDSIFFYPASQIRADIIELHPDVAAISFFRKGLTGLSIKINDRVPIARWCGLSPTLGVEEYCYVFDASGLIFAAADLSSQPLNPFRVYAPLKEETEEPLHATVAHAEKLPSTFDFARQLGTFGSPVTHIVFQQDEVHQHLTSGTRITYVLGNEQNAYTALVSSKENINLIDGSIDYIDLRFDGKVYVKKKQ
jgi:hypothetical protein